MIVSDTTKNGDNFEITQSIKGSIKTLILELAGVIFKMSKNDADKSAQIIAQVTLAVKTMHDFKGRGVEVNDQ